MDLYLYCTLWFWICKKTKKKKAKPRTCIQWGNILHSVAGLVLTPSLSLDLSILDDFCNQTIIIVVMLFPPPPSPSSFPQIVMAIANADIANATLKERWTFATPTPLVARKMAALLQVNSKIIMLYCLLYCFFTDPTAECMSTRWGRRWDCAQVLVGHFAELANLGEREECSPPTGHPLHGCLQGTKLAEDNNGQNDGELQGEMPSILTFTTTMILVY